MTSSSLPLKLVISKFTIFEVDLDFSLDFKIRLFWNKQFGFQNIKFGFQNIKLAKIIFNLAILEVRLR